MFINDEAKKKYKQLKASKLAQAQSENLGMSWFLFTVDFRLILGALSYIMNFISVCISDNREGVLAHAVLCIIFVSINLYLRYSLSGFFKNSLKIYFALMYAIPIIIGVFAALVTEDVTFLVNPIALLLLIIPDLVYYHKRKHLFNVSREHIKPLIKITLNAKYVIICAIYLLALVIQIAFFTPYIKTETYISSQNVPHVITVDRGFASFDFANGYTKTGEKGTISRIQVDYPIAALQLAFTTVLAVLSCYLVRRSSSKKDAPAPEDIGEPEILKKQILQLQEVINNLSGQVDKITLENEALRGQIMHFYSNPPPSELQCEMFANTQNFSSDALLDDNLPTLDINSLAFADEETIQRAQKQYAENVYNYIKNKLTNNQKNY